MDELFEKMQKLIVEKLDIDAAKVTLDASFRNDLGADSLDTYELVYAIEEELGVKMGVFDEVKMLVEAGTPTSGSVDLFRWCLICKGGIWERSS